MMAPFHKVLIANRGEIAVRILRACHELGLATVAVYSEADSSAQHAELADEAVCIGAAPPLASYLNQEALIQAAHKSGADAVHPGYGFLSENAEFAQACADAGLVFIGPSPENMARMGSKMAARQWVQELGLPVIPGYHGDDQSLARLRQEAESMGLPVLIKASAGGGGRGMRLLTEQEALESQLQAAQREAEQAFGDGSVYLEKYLPRIRHIEFQILADSHGHVIHCFERECSLQRRYQKIIEESPSPALSAELRQKMGAAAVRIAQALNYVGAGTVEFVLDDDSQHFYFLEMNTRLQVEHPVTEAVTGLDLVHWQLKIAAGEVLYWQQGDLIQRGHAIECRICAEDAYFTPASGKILKLQTPDLPYARWDGGVISGDEVGVHYDSMLAKLIVWGETRARALQRMERALAQTQLMGLSSNLNVLQQLIQDPQVRTGEFYTRFIEDRRDRFETDLNEEQAVEAAIISRLVAWQQSQIAHLPGIPRKWSNTRRAPESFTVHCGPHEISLHYTPLPPTQKAPEIQRFSFVYQERNIPVRLFHSHSEQPDLLRVEIDGLCRNYTVAGALERWENENVSLWVHAAHWGNQNVQLQARFPQAEQAEKHGGYRAAMPAKILEVLVSEGQHVESGAPLLILESMKMETRLNAAEAGTVSELYVEAGQTVERDTILLRLDAETASAESQA